MILDDSDPDASEREVILEIDGNETGQNASAREVIVDIDGVETGQIASSPSFEVCFRWLCS